MEAGPQKDQRAIHHAHVVSKVNPAVAALAAARTTKRDVFLSGRIVLFGYAAQPTNITKAIAGSSGMRDSYLPYALLSARLPCH